jgi:hypothetical protein
MFTPTHLLYHIVAYPLSTKKFLTHRITKIKRIKYEIVQVKNEKRARLARRPKKIIPDMTTTQDLVAAKEEVTVPAK